MTADAADPGFLLGTNEVRVVPSVITDEEQSILEIWAVDKRVDGQLLANPRDSHSYYTPFLSAASELTSLTGGGPEGSQNQDNPLWIPPLPAQSGDRLPDAFWQIRARVIDRLGLGSLHEDPYKGSFLTYIEVGGHVPEHRDVRLHLKGESYLILRCNAIFLKPTFGGNPIISGHEFSIPELGMWAFYATEANHSANKVMGSRARGTLSFGFLVDPARLSQRRFAVTLDELSTAQGRPSGFLERLLRFLPNARAGFSVTEAATALHAREETVQLGLDELQSRGVVRSLSSQLSGVTSLTT